MGKKSTAVAVLDMVSKKRIYFCHLSVRPP